MSCTKAVTSKRAPRSLPKLPLVPVKSSPICVTPGSASWSS
jgi:hypothetical protein